MAASRERSLMTFYDKNSYKTQDSAQIEVSPIDPSLNFTSRKGQVYLYLLFNVYTYYKRRRTRVSRTYPRASPVYGVPRTRSVRSVALCGFSPPLATLISQSGSHRRCHATSGLGLRLGPDPQERCSSGPCGLCDLRVAPSLVWLFSGRLVTVFPGVSW